MIFLAFFCLYNTIDVREDKKAGISMVAIKSTNTSIEYIYAFQLRAIGRAVLCTNSRKPFDAPNMVQRNNPRGGPSKRATPLNSKLSIR